MNYISRCDFVVRYDPDVDTKEDLTKRILYSIIIKRLKANKPAISFLGGDSGEGKSWAALRLQEILLEIQGLYLKDYIDDVNVYTPLEYAQKLDNMLYEKRLKKVNIITIHEAREVIKAKLWHSFASQAIADVNAMSRGIKPLNIIIISQFIRDITTDVRYSINFYMTVSRPKNKRSRLYINVMWKDDSDLEKPKLRKRKLSGYVVMPDGRYKRYVPQYLIMSKPQKDIRDVFEKADKESKTTIIRNKLSRLVDEMKLDIGDTSDRVNRLVDYYMNNIDNLSSIGRRWRGKWRINTDATKMLDMNKKEIESFQIIINDRLKNEGVIKDGE